jgi:hypothetical protein
VTGLDEFSPSGWLCTLSSVFKNVISIPLFGLINNNVLGYIVSQISVVILVADYVSYQTGWPDWAFFFHCDERLTLRFNYKRSRSYLGAGSTEKLFSVTYKAGPMKASSLDEDEKVFVFLKYFVADAFIYPFSTHKQCILCHFIHNSTSVFP